MTNSWTKERRERQSLRIRTSRPWEKATGPRTPEGKAKSRQNAWKNRGYRKEEISRWRDWRLESKSLLAEMFLCCSGPSFSRLGMRRIRHILEYAFYKAQVEEKLINEINHSSPEIQLKVLNKIIELKNTHEAPKSAPFIEQCIQEILRAA